MAQFMSDHADFGMEIFSRFSELNTHNLLYMQAELLNLEHELKLQTHIDHLSPDTLPKSYEKSVRSLMQSDNSQWQKALEIREKLKEYNNALLAQVAVYKLSKPTKHDFTMLKHWLLSSEVGNQFLSSFEARPYKSRTDLLSVSRTSEEDAFTRWLQVTVFPWLYTCLSHRWKTIARIATVLLSVLLPSSSIRGLYFIKSFSARLGAVVGFSTMFSFVLAVFTKARPIEIFTATAAFAAVQVVFVGSTTAIANVYPAN